MCLVTKEGRGCWRTEEIQCDQSEKGRRLWEVEKKEHLVLWCKVMSELASHEQCCL